MAELSRSPVTFPAFSASDRQMTKKTCEFGDFQTPDELARASLSALSRFAFTPRSVVEPTCGMGAFVLASIAAFPNAEVLAGEINPDHIQLLNARLSEEGRARASVLECNFFTTDWDNLISDLPEPILIVGNYPWVTSAALGALNSSNIPQKTNFRGYSGLDALMGKSNFDISEWMLLRNLNWLKGKSGAIAMLCKTAVARKILRHCWKHDFEVADAAIFKIDAVKWFGAAVDACLFILQVGKKGPAQCQVFSDISAREPHSTFGFDAEILVSNIDNFLARKHLLGNDRIYAWRSGIKHDCAKVMELTEVDGTLFNGHGDILNIERDFLFPLLKSSDVNGKKAADRKKFLIVTQTSVGADTSHISKRAPRTWEYLKSHEITFLNRGSSIYKGKPPFSIFGVGDYSFSPWKVAISGLYKSLDFKVVGPIRGKPVVFDDTVYFLPCQSEEEALSVRAILQSEPCIGLISSLVFWDEKRPITADLLKKISLLKVADEVGISTAFPIFRKPAYGLFDAAV